MTVVHYMLWTLGVLSVIIPLWAMCGYTKRIADSCEAANKAAGITTLGSNDRITDADR